MNGSSRDVYALLFPVVDSVDAPQWLCDGIASGVQAVILGESRSEYVARTMSEERRSSETRTGLKNTIRSIRAAAGESDVLIAVDQEPWGIRRLHALVPALDIAPGDDVATFERKSFQMSTEADRLGVGMLLAPVLDRLSGHNPWLNGRTLTADYDRIGSLAAAFVSGARRAGIATAVKHFPGFPVVTADPALDLAEVPKGEWTTDSLEPFRDCIAAGTAAVMVGPVPVLDIDATEPATTSRAVIALLRTELGFDGVIIGDDLGAPGTRMGRSVPETALAAVRAGVDLLLVSGPEEMTQVAERLEAEVAVDEAFAGTVSASAARVRALATRRRPS
ncbi:glycoside hydrolase family 3 N-terminal domain-containing protein [Rhodococcus sp. IEGM 1381]|uniref:glycoside hydrolase family 3 N-terminal domain-containing protein n=1 Tax=Rhodococcus sp. IEGM 1381 TaxID=3047085 RepID=UPI0024B735AF|nr:glycoside hydrolase family 3 N-terminal domain-containing protein [Rhodococcus sp. IEGM 1381]MDI9893171.1 glycoside hydrolase family 3 N-terminal domain-containing protein [Rhodococcus sp. IEGM 1381]